MTMIDVMLEELEEEAKTTRSVLERVPNDKLSWKPHPKARTLGELALHIALVPGGVAEFATSSSSPQAPDFVDPVSASAAELVPALEQSVATVRRMLGGMDDAALTSTLRVM